MWSNCKCYSGILKLQFALFPSSSVCLKWRLLDPKLAAWLLNPDHPPQSFSEVLTSVELHLPEVRAHIACNAYFLVE